MKALFLLITTIFLVQEKPIPVVLGESFVVDKSEIAVYKEENITVKVLKISDSRCPENTNCVWAGELAVDIEINASGKKKSHSVVIPAIGKANAKSIVELGAYQLHFEGESPKRKAKKIATDGVDMKLKFKMIRLE